VSYEELAVENKSHSRLTAACASVDTA
jgi:hypothetical protein